MTVSKIFILGPADVLPVLTSFIELKNIPKAYGGELEWDFYDKPRWDEPEFQRIFTFVNGYTEVPDGPMYLREKEDGKTIELVALGTKDQKQRKEVFATIPKAFPAKTEAASTTNGTTAAEAAPVEAAPVEVAPVEVAPVEVAPVEAAPAETAPAPAAPVEEISKLSVNDAQTDGTAISEKAVAEPVAAKETTTVTS